MTEEDYTQSQVARQLGVSEKTVYRDLKKLKRYVSSLEYKRQQTMQDALRQKLNSYPPEARYAILTDLMISRGGSNETRVFQSFLKGKLKVSKKRGED